MNVAPATALAPKAHAFMAARNGLSVREQDDTGILPKSKIDEPLIGRYPLVAFSYHEDASRLVLLYRDPATGETVSQLPSEAALKQYEEAEKKKRTKERSGFEVIVGGAEGQGGRARTAEGTTAGSTKAGTPAPSSAAEAPVRKAAPSPSTGGPDSAKVDLVI